MDKKNNNTEKNIEELLSNMVNEVQNQMRDEIDVIIKDTFYKMFKNKVYEAINNNTSSDELLAIARTMTRKQNDSSNFPNAWDLLNIPKDNPKFKFDPNKLHVVKNKLKEYIKKSPYSQMELAKMAGISDKTLSNIVNNKFNTSMEVGLKLCYVLGIRVEDAFYLEELTLENLLDENENK